MRRCLAAAWIQYKLRHDSDMTPIAMSTSRKFSAIDAPSDAEEPFSKVIDKGALVNKRRLKTERLKLARTVSSSFICSANKMEKEKYVRSNSFPRRGD